MVQLAQSLKNLCFRQAVGDPVILKVRIPVDRSARESLWKRYFKQTRDRTGRVQTISPTKEDARQFARELFVLVVADWNVDDRAGNRVPLNESTYEDYIGFLPSSVGKTLMQVAFNDPIDDQDGSVYFAETEADIEAHEVRSVAEDVDPKG